MTSSLSTGAPASVLTTDRAAHSGALRRIVAGSLITGAASAAVLTLVVFPGAPEHVITGVALLGFAVGWTLLALVSAWRTDRPQRWALVPAAGMAGTGLVLVMTAPDDRLLTAAGWGWPPALLVLTAWMTVRARRGLARGSGRWLLYPVAAVMASVAAGGMLETVGLATDQRDHAMPGRLYDVGGYRLHLYCVGSGSPTVVLQNGLGETSANWSRITPAVSSTTRVCAYDRAGQGWSESAPHPQDGLQATDELHTLLHQAGERGPFVLVGHSIGGDYAMTYATRFPKQVAGMVLLDATDPYRSASTSPSDGAPPAMVALLPSLARLGIGRLLPIAFWSALPQPAAGQVRAFASSPRGWRNTCDEYATLPALLSRTRTLETLASTPTVVITAAGHDGDPDWATAQDRMAALSTNSSHLHADVSHSGLLEEQRGAAVSAHAIDDVVHAVRTSTAI